MIDAVRPDVVVIGGGPSGATVATLVAKAGFRVQLLERERFPRYHVGESLIPYTFLVLDRRGMPPMPPGSRSVQTHPVNPVPVTHMSLAAY